MLKFNMVLADKDIHYVESLSKFIRTNFASRFNVHIFTQPETLVEFLGSSIERVDIILINNDMLCRQVQEYNSGITIILSDGRDRSQSGELPWVYKYQTGDKVVKSIIEIYSNSDSNIEGFIKGDKKTVVISTISPQGGSGKTIISLNLSIQLSKLGLKTLYLNMESVSSTSFFISVKGSGYGLSSLLYYLKEGNKNMAVRIDSAKSYDSCMNIYYFEPVDCCLELDDMSEEDVQRLIAELKGYGQFDAIVVDTDPGLNRRNTALLSSSNCIIMILNEDSPAAFRLGIMNSNWKKVAYQHEPDVWGNMLLLLNKCSEGVMLRDAAINGKAIDYRIPYIEDIFTMQGESLKFNQYSGMGRYVGEIARDIVGKFKGDDGKAV